MPRCGSGSVPIAIGWKCTNCRRTHRSSIPRSAFGNTRARPELTTGTSQPPRNWSAPCHGSSERCNSILNRSDPICFLFADRDVPLLMRGCIAVLKAGDERSLCVGEGEPQRTFSDTDSAVDAGRGGLGLLIGLEANVVEQGGFRE